MNTTKTYPYSAWVLTPSFKPKQVTIVKQSYYDTWDRSDSGKEYLCSTLNPTLSVCIAFGERECDRMQADIHKKQASLDKKRAELAKAKGAQ